MSITKAFILGAGLGTRLQPLTNFLPKPLVPMWNEPLVFHVLRHCQRAGIDSFAINTHHLPDCWPRTFPEGCFEGASVELFHEPVLLETGGGIKNIESFIGDDSILVFNGDIISDVDLKGLIAAHEASNNIATLAVKSSGPNCNIAVDGNQVTDLRHARGIHPGNHQFTGIYCISPDILSLLPANQKISIVPAFLKLAEQGKLGAFNVDQASWIDIGTIETYRDAHQDATLADHYGSYLSTDATVEKECHIVDSIVWPGATIKSGSTLKNCIVYSDTPVCGDFSDELL